MKNSFRISSIFLKSYYINAIIVFFAEMTFVNENEKYEIENILKNIKKWEKLYYLVRWEILWK